MIHLTNCHGEITALLSALPALAYIVALWTRRAEHRPCREGQRHIDASGA